MAQVIIYKTADGVAVIHPTDEALSLMGIYELADKDVPTGSPYKIIDISELPTDRAFRGAWVIEETTLTDGVGA